MKIQEYLRQSGVSFETHEHMPAYTAQEVAAAEHVSGKQLAKTVVINSSKGYAMCVLPAHQKLDMDKAARLLNTSGISLADEKEMAGLFADSEVGAEPPFGGLYDLPTLVDQQLTCCEEIVFQAGDHRHTIRLRYEDYSHLANPIVGDLVVQL